MFQFFASKTVRPGCVVLAITASLWCAHAIRAQEPENDELRKVNQSVRALIRKVSPSVVQILVTGFGAVEQAQRGNTGVVIGRQKAIGSGFVIDANGYIITNAHVVKGAENILAQLAPGGGKLDDYIDASLLDEISKEGFIAALEQKYNRK